MARNGSQWLAPAVNKIMSKLGYSLPLPFSFLGFLVNLIQAFVLTLLVAVYIGLIYNHGEEEEKVVGKS
jgi:F0F1-type ATP synthase membrane subunit a